MKQVLKATLLLIIFSITLKAEDISAEKEILKSIENQDVYSVKGWKITARAKHFWEMRTFGGKNPITAENILNAYRLATKSNVNKNNRLQAIEWTKKGPIGNPISSNNKFGIGRINCIRFRPNTSEIWVGSAGGGVWKTTNSGTSWLEVPYTDVLSICISDIAFSNQNNNIVYVATGDFDASLASSNPYYSVGVLKSTDGGNSWAELPLKYELRNQQIISRIMINPNNDNEILVGATDGIHKSTNAGQSFTKVSSEAIADMEFKPGNPSIIYASTTSRGGSSVILKSTNSGTSFTTIQTISNSFRTAIAVTAANPNKIYALSTVNSKYALQSVLVSENEGATFETLMELGKPGYKNILGWVDGTDDKGQGFYDLTLAVNPKNEDDVYFGGVNIWRTTDGGGTFVFTTHWNGGYGKPFVHADHHDLIFDPNSNEIYAGHDGGIDKFSGNKWVNLNANLAIMQFYKIDIDQTSAPNIVAGAQDNGSAYFANNIWKNVLGGDGMDCAADPLDKQRLYCSIYFGAVSRSTNGGTNFNLVIDTAILRKNYGSAEAGAWVAPVELDPTNPKNLYVGYNNIWKSDNYGATGSFKKISNFGFPISNTFRLISISPKDGKYIYAATIGTIYMTSDGGTNWKNIYNSTSSISDIAVDYNNPMKIYITQSNFTGNDKVIIWQNDTLTNISGNLPNVPVNCIEYQNNSPDRIYIGTDIGVYFSDYNSAKWIKMEGNLPNVVVTDLEINYPTKTLYAGTYGKGVWTTKINEFNEPKVEIQANSAIEFCRGDSVVLTSKIDYPNYLWSNGETTKSIVVKESGLYYLTIPKDEINSAKSELIKVNVLDRNLLVVSSSQNKSIICEGDSVRLTANFGFQSYNWSDGSKKRILDIKQSGRYILSASNFNNCIEVSKEYEFTFLPKPQIEDIKNESGVLTAPEAKDYKWYFGDSLIIGENNRILNTSKVGSYKVEYQIEGFCPIMTSPIVVTKTDVETELFANEIHIFPNPNNGNFELALSNSSNSKVTIKNMIGQVVFENEYSKANVRIELSNFAKGIYFIEVIQNSEVKIKKLVIE